jgi:hypothetical protein
MHPMALIGRATTGTPTSGTAPCNIPVVLAIFSCFTNFHRVATFFTDSRTPPVRYRMT